MGRVMVVMVERKQTAERKRPWWKAMMIMMEAIDCTNLWKVDTVDGIHNNFFYFKVTGSKTLACWPHNNIYVWVCVYCGMDTCTAQGKKQVKLLWQ